MFLIWVSRWSSCWRTPATTLVITRTPWPLKRILAPPGSASPSGATCDWWTTPCTKGATPALGSPCTPTRTCSSTPNRSISSPPFPARQTRAFSIPLTSPGCPLRATRFLNLCGRAAKRSPFTPPTARFTSTPGATASAAWRREPRRRHSPTSGSHHREREKAARAEQERREPSPAARLPAEPNPEPSNPVRRLEHNRELLRAGGPRQGERLERRQHRLRPLLWPQRLAARRCRSEGARQRPGQPLLVHHPPATARWEPCER